MKTKTGQSFGLALLVAIAAIATMFALGMFSANEASAGHNTTNATHVLTMVPSSSSVNAKVSWNITLGVSGGGLTAGTGTIDIKFPTGVVLPATIDKTRISVGTNNSTTGGADYVMFPLTSDPTVSGQTLTLTVPGTDAGGTALDGGKIILVDHQVQIFISQLAGIVNPAKSGDAGKIADKTAGQIKTSADTVFGNIPVARSFNKTISISKISAAEGDEVVVTLGGFEPGSTVTLTGDGPDGNGTTSIVSGSGVVGSDRKAVISGTMKSTSGKVGAKDTSGGFIAAADGKTVTIKPTLIVTASGRVGETITLTGKNFTEDGNVPGSSSITFGGTPLATDKNTTEFGEAGTEPKSHEDNDADGNDDDFSIKITIPSNASKGANTVKVTDSGTDISASAVIEVEPRSITISPTSGPPGTTITVTGSGFPASRIAADANFIGLSPDFATDGTLTPDTTKTIQLFTDGAGSLSGSDQIKIPASATKTVITVKVTIVGADGATGTATAKFTVGDRVLTLSPDSGPRGTKFLVSGTKFTANATVTAGSVTVDGKPDTGHVAITLTSAGDVPATTIVVPKDAGIGSKTVSLSDGDLIGTAKFNVTQPDVALSVDSATMGQTVTVTGSGWVPASSVTVTLKVGSAAKATAVVVVASDGTISADIEVPSTVGVGSKTVTFAATDTLGNTSTSVAMNIPKPTISLSSAEAVVGDVITVELAGFTPNSGLSKLEIGGADVRSGVSTSDGVGSLSVEFLVPGLTGSQLITVKIGGTAEVSTSIAVVKAKGTAAAATTAPAVIFADVIANADNLVRVWRFSNADQSWAFYDPRPAFDEANTLAKSGAGDIVWVNVTAEQAFQGGTLFPGWNLISLK